MIRQEMLRWTHPAVILVATDLNDLTRLMPVAIEQASQSGARLILLHVLPTIAELSTDVVGLPYYNPSGVLDFADKALQPWCDSARRQGIACDALVREGNAAQQVAAATRQFQADRVLLGTRSRSKLSKLLLGSVAEQVLRSVNLPVITVGPEAHLPVEEGGEQVVLHATTLRETSRPSAALACSIAASRKQPLVLLHVLPSLPEMERKGIPAGRDSTAARELLNLAASTGAQGCPRVEPVVLHGNPAIEILATAEERHASLIVLGSTYRSAFENLTRDRTVYRVLAHASCPVLTLRDPLAQPAELQEEQVAATYR
jgi:nucleotide-binding universal stress UspA family protein